MANNPRQHGVPVLIQAPDSPAVPLEPVPRGSPPFREDKLQALLAAHPEVLPVAEIEPAFAPLVYLGREIPTPSGFLDVLYVSPAGYLTLVEAKLWDNPQARREVVGQIVEYAKDFSRWTFEDLDAAVRRAGGPGSAGILDRVRQRDPDVEEAAFIDTVTRALRRGAFLLLVVGDGIREGVETLAAYLQRTPSLHFSLGLIELALFRTTPGQDWPLLVQPRTVARTAEVVRAVVEVRAPAGLEVAVALPSEKTEGGSKAGRTLTEDAFFEQLAESTSQGTASEVGELVGELGDLGIVPSWGTSGVSLRLPDPGGLGRHWTVVGLLANGTFALGWLDFISKDGGYDPAIWRRYLRDVTQLTGAVMKQNQDATKPAPVQKLLQNRAEFIAVAQRFIEDLREAALAPEAAMPDAAPVQRQQSEGHSEQKQER